MQHYLRTTRDVLLSIQSIGEIIDVVMGNEACDLDSAVSAIVYGFYLQSKKGRITPTSPHNVSNEFAPCYNLCQHNASVLPLMNIPKKELPLRTEVTFLLNEYELLQNSLSFRDEIDLKRLLEDKRLQIHLVDHNKLFGNDAELDEAVVEVIDHHKEERLPSKNCTTNIEMVGSCCTLIAETILKESPEFLTSDSALIPLLLGTILLDTVNLSHQAGRATAKDFKIVEQLHKLRPHLNKNEVFAKLQSAKFDVSTLSTKNLLRKDMKAVHGVSSSPTLGHFAVAISSITMHLKDFLKRENVEQEMMDFAIAEEFSVIVLMGIITNENGDIERQLGIYSTNVNQREMIVSCLQSISLDLQLLKLPGVTLANTAAFTQANVKSSRKQILPALKEFLKTV